jgi:hypothetical protein
VCRDPIGITVVEKPFKVSEKRSSGGRVPLSTRATTARSAEVEESFEDSKRTKLRRESVFMHRAIAARNHRG